MLAVSPRTQFRYFSGNRKMSLECGLRRTSQYDYNNSTGAQSAIPSVKHLELQTLPMEFLV